MSRSKKLPPEIVKHWPEVFEDVEVEVLPIEYLHSVQVTFTDGKVWDIDLKTGKEDVDIGSAIGDLVEEYEDTIMSVDFKLDTDKVKKDITSRTARFLKKRK